MLMIRAVMLSEPRMFKNVRIDRPVPGPGEALVRVLKVGICGWEVLGYDGRHFGRCPSVVRGHEVCGIVDTLGDGVTKPAPGTRVVAMPQKNCGICPPCRDNHLNRCQSRSMLGFPKWPGAFGAYFVIPADLLFPVDNGLSAAAATLIEPLAVAVHAVRRAGVKTGHSVAVLGSGAVGLLTVLAALHAGANLVFATDLFDFNLRMARTLGATHIHSSHEGSIVGSARAATADRGVDHAFLAAGAPELADQAVRAVRDRGTVTVIAMYDKPILIPLQTLKSKEQALIDSLTYEAKDFRTACDIAALHAMALSNLITRRFSIEQASDAFEMVANRQTDLARARVLYG